MSADNCICILQTRDSNGQPRYRVALAFALENLDCHRTRSWYIELTWGKSRIHSTLHEAEAEARQISASHEPTEYGIIVQKMDNVIF